MIILLTYWYILKLIENTARRRRRRLLIINEEDDNNAGIQSVLVYIHVEHQSTPDKLMPLRMLSYRLALLNNYVSSKNTKKDLPVIYSMVYYHGNVSPYPYSVDIYNMFKNPELAKNSLLNNTLIDLSVMSEDELHTHHKAIKHIEFIFKNVIADSLKALQYLVKHYEEFKDNSMILNYVAYYANYDIPETQEELKKLNERINVMRDIDYVEERPENFVSVYDHFVGEGIKKGMVAVAKKLKASNMSIFEIAKLTDLSEDEIMQLC